MNALKGLILDMDGVLWHGDKPLPGLTDFFAMLQRRNIKYTLATNNSSRKPEGFAEKAFRLGFDINPRDIITSGTATLRYLREKYPPGSRIHVISDAPLKEQIAGAGFELADETVAAVVVSMDRSLTYETIKRGTLLIRDGAEFIATNADASYPAEEGLLPGSGTLVAAFAASTDRQPVVMGKPEPGIFELALKQMGLTAGQVASVGDRLETDIAGGQRLGMRTILLLSGVTTPAILENSPIQPGWLFPGLVELTEAIEKGEIA